MSLLIVLLALGPACALLFRQFRELAELRVRTQELHDELGIVIGASRRMRQDLDGQHLELTALSKRSR